MIDVNMPEIVLLVAFAVIFFGPEKLPDLARKAARVVNHLRRIGSDARTQLRQELGPEFDDIRLSDLNPTNFVARHILSGDEVADLRSLRDDAVASGQLVRSSLDEATGSLSASEPEASQPVAVRVVAFDPEAT